MTAKYPRRTNKQAAELGARLQALRASGMTCAAIVRTTGLKRTTVEHYLGVRCKTFAQLNS